MDPQQETTVRIQCTNCMLGVPQLQGVQCECLPAAQVLQVHDVHVDAHRKAERTQV